MKPSVGALLWALKHLRDRASTVRATFGPSAQFDAGRIGPADAAAIVEVCYIAERVILQRQRNEAIANCAPPREGDMRAMEDAFMEKHKDAHLIVAYTQRHPIPTEAVYFAPRWEAGADTLDFFSAVLAQRSHLEEDA